MLDSDPLYARRKVRGDTAMASNTFQSLHELLGVSPRIVRYFQSQKSGNSIESVDLVGVEKLRHESSTSLSSLSSELQALDDAIGVPAGEYFSDCACVIGVAAALQGVLSAKLQAKGRNISQSETHLLVDLWGQIEASKAIYEFVLRYTEEYVSGSGDRSVALSGIRAQCRVLGAGLERLVVSLGGAFAEHGNMAEVAKHIDWSLKLLKSDRFRVLQGAVSIELAGLAA